MTTCYHGHLEAHYHAANYLLMLTVLCDVGGETSGITINVTCKILLTFTWIKCRPLVQAIVDVLIWYVCMPDVVIHLLIIFNLTYKIAIWTWNLNLKYQNKSTHFDKSYMKCFFDVEIMFVLKTSSEKIISFPKIYTCFSYQNSEMEPDLWRLSVSTTRQSRHYRCN
jgi:hypothetical protein